MVPCSNREKSPFLWCQVVTWDERANSSPKVGESLTERPKKKKPTRFSKSSSMRSTDDEKSPSPRKRRWLKKRRWSWSKKQKKKKRQRYLSSPSPSSVSNNNSGKSKMETMRAMKAQVPDLEWFLIRIRYLQIWYK